MINPYLVLGFGAFVALAAWCIIWLDERPRPRLANGHPYRRS